MSGGLASAAVARLLAVALANAVAVLPLALVAALAAWRWRWKRPRVVHLLWVAVLARLLMPPLLPIPALPPGVAVGGPGPGAVEAPAGPRPALPMAVETRPVALVPRAGGRGWGTAACGVWGIGTLVALAKAAARTRRFRRLLAAASPPPPQLGARLRGLARRLGITPPPLQVVESPLPPLVWSWLGPPRIVVCRPLVERLAPPELDAVLAHELAHVRRRDHWVRHLEVAAAVLFWWHPVAAWARRALRRVEERCCDLEVLRALPGTGPAYARALVTTLDTLRGGELAVPAASRFETATTLKERLRMILDPPERPSRSRSVAAFACLAVAVAGLVVFPVRAQRSDTGAAETPPTPAAQEAPEAGPQRAEAVGQEEAELRTEQRRLTAEIERLEAQRNDADTMGEEAAAVAGRLAELRRELAGLARQDARRQWRREAEDFARLQEELEAAALAARDRQGAAAAERLAARRRELEEAFARSREGADAAAVERLGEELERLRQEEIAGVGRQLESQRAALEAERQELARQLDAERAASAELRDRRRGERRRELDERTEDLAPELRRREVLRQLEGQLATLRQLLAVAGDDGRLGDRLEALGEEARALFEKE